MHQPDQEMMMKTLIGAETDAAMFPLIYYNWRYLLINLAENLILLFQSTASQQVAGTYKMNGVYSDLYLYD